MSGVRLTEGSLLVPVTLPRSLESGETGNREPTVGGVSGRHVDQVKGRGGQDHGRGRGKTRLRVGRDPDGCPRRSLVPDRDLISSGLVSTKRVVKKVLNIRHLFTGTSLRCLYKESDRN